jgi:hypothetical protein
MKAKSGQAIDELVIIKMFRSNYARDLHCNNGEIRILNVFKIFL